MKLIKVKTKLTSSELLSVFENVSIEELEVILNMSKYFDYIDVDYSDRKSGFFAIISSSAFSSAFVNARCCSSDSKSKTEAVAGLSFADSLFSSVSKRFL